MNTIELTCIGCPLGCPLTVTLENGIVSAVSGNTCPKGEAYAKKEVTNPTRIVTSTVKVKNGVCPMVNVKTANDIPKEKIFDCTNALRNVVINAPIHIGDIIIPNVAGTGVDVIAARNVDAV